MNDLIGHTLLGRYRVESFVGRGGMAEVYKVWDEKRSVYLAMKLLREDLAEDRIFLRRFKREAKTLANLQHPNIVRFYGLEQDEELAFMLMDFVEGTSLRREIFRAKRPMSLARVLEVMRPVCSALHYAHQMGIVHCDAKPGNIMIDNSGKVLVTDFGIARMTDAATATMVGMGTPAYMAPEQVQGKDPTPRSDIYALGVMLFEMLTGGERPFTGERADTTGSTSEKVRWEQMNLRPPSPSKWNPNISPELAQIVLRCLDKDPAQRFGSTLELLNALAQTGTGVQPEMMPEPILVDEAEREVEAQPVKSTTNPMLWVGIGILVVLIALLFSGGGDTTGTTPPQEVEQVVVVVTATEIREEVILATPTAEIVPTATSTVVTNTKTPTKTKKPSSTPDPREAREDKVMDDVRTYYGYIDSQRYDLAWDYLTWDFRERNFDNEIDRYIDGYGTTDGVEIKDLTVVDYGTKESTVDVWLLFSAGVNKWNQPLRLTLEWSQSLEIWQIDSSTPIK